MSVILKHGRRCVSKGEMGRCLESEMKDGEEEGWKWSVRSFGCFLVRCPTVLPCRLVETVCMDWVNLSQKHATIFQP